MSKYCNRKKYKHVVEDLSHSTEREFPTAREVYKMSTERTYDEILMEWWNHRERKYGIEFSSKHEQIIFGIEDAVKYKKLKFKVSFDQESNLEYEKYSDLYKDFITRKLPDYDLKFEYSFNDIKVTVGFDLDDKKLEETVKASEPDIIEEPPVLEEEETKSSFWKFWK